MAETGDGDVGAAAAAAAAPADVPPEAAVGAPAEAPVGDIAERLLQPPYSEETLQKILTFFQKRRKNPQGYTYSADGNLETKEGAKAGKKRKPEPAGTLYLKRFVPLDPTERGAIEESRMETLAGLEDEYESASQELREAWATYEQTGAMRAVLAANQKVAELDARRSAARSAVRSVSIEQNPVTRNILLNQPYEMRKLFQTGDPFLQELVRMSFHDFKLEQELGKYVADEDAPKEEADAAAEAAAIPPDQTSYRQKLADGRVARIFFDTDSEVNGFLSPMFPVEFQMESVNYACPVQAYEAERARELGKGELATSLLKTRSGRTVRLMTRKTEGHPRDARGLWFRIYTAVYQQHPELREKLLATGTDALVFADTREGPSGIGLGEKDSGALDPSRWKSENAVGLAQESVRTRLREESLAEAPVGAAKGGAITEEEQEKAKVGAIIHAARRRAGSA